MRAEARVAGPATLEIAVPAWVALVSALDGGRQREVPLHLGVSLFVALAARR